MKIRAGFTLIELSIVLVIIGLLIAGVLVGKDLIESATIREQISQIDEIKAAHTTFTLKYNAVAGDMWAKTGDFGLEGGNGAGNRDNSVIDDMLGNVDFAWVPTYEPVYFFGHLVDAGLYKKSMVCEEFGQGITYGFHATAINPTAGMVVFSMGTQPWLFLGINEAATGGVCNMFNINGISTGGVMTPAQAFAIDTKLDDGIPASGVIRATIMGPWSLDGTIDNNVADCVVDATSLAYNTTNTNIACRLIVKL